MALGKKTKKTRQFVTPKLQITAMMDMFTIVLIFLIFSFSDKPETIDIDRELALPKSIAKMDYSDTIKLSLSQQKLQIEGKLIARLENGKIIGLDPKKLHKSKLYKELRSYREGLNTIDPEANTNRHILFLCDKRIPFKTINNVVKTAGLAGFPKFQFAVLKK